MEEQIVCPWCQTLTTVNEDSEVHCTNCNRLITEEDLEYAAQQDN